MHTNKKRFHYLPVLVVLVLMLSTYPIKAQTIKRWTGGKEEISAKQMSVEQRLSIFNEYLWLSPDLNSVSLNITNNEATHMWKGNLCSFSLKKDGEMTFRSKDQEITSPRIRSNKNLYYSKQALRYKPEVRHRWVAQHHHESKPVVVYKTRTVYKSQYDYYSKTSKSVAVTENYSTIEYRNSIRTEWKWQSYTNYVLDIPEYSYYSFKTEDSTIVYVYEIEEGSSKKYYLQHASYLLGKDNDGIYYVITDSDHNGYFFDDKDQILFNSWNPFREDTKYKRVRFFSENNWYTLDHLKNDYMLTVYSDSNKVLHLEYANSMYADIDKKGKVLFTNIPEDATLTVNGKKYKVGKAEKQFNCEYGLFKVNISKAGNLDFETTYLLNDSLLRQTINYTEMPEAIDAKILNIFADDYMVTISSKNGYSHSCFNTNSFKLPIGENTISISTGGFTLVQQVETKVGDKLEIDFESELQKLQSPINKEQNINESEPEKK